MRIVMPAKSWCLAALCAVSLLVCSGSQAQEDTEDAVKAGFVLNFAKYVDWKDAGVTGNTLAVCSLSSQVLSGKLLQLEGRMAQGRRVLIRGAVRPSEMRGCQVLFIAAEESSRIDAMLSLVASHPVLTISDAPGFIQSGGIIELKLREGKVRFDISKRAANKAGLILGSQLLRLAEEVQH